ncbi:unnamed protein product [Ceratitis capitata]|uniref:(Mediterranean fruit fly) hypothetical protein n=1 Tax=Ceratitis capitata TaxID=7213 RepID=A0A811UH78_CERCA|nr:unnamed protein product [Ceratitis capitata]
MLYIAAAAAIQCDVVVTKPAKSMQLKLQGEEGDRCKVKKNDFAAGSRRETERRCSWVTQQP